MTAREQANVDKMVDEVKSRGGWAHKTHGGSLRAGLPDLLCCVYGQFVAVEVKARGKRASKRQQAELTRIRRAGGLALVADDVADLSRALDALHAA